MQSKNLGIYYDKFLLNGFGGVENYALFLYEKLSKKKNIIFICDKSDEYFYYDRNGQEINYTHKFDFIINLSGIDHNKTFKLCKEFNKIPIITILHMDPGEIIYRISSRIGLKSKIFIKLISFIYEKTSKIRKSSIKFKSNYKSSILTLVIAEEYINKFCLLNGIKKNEMESIDYILNPLINLKNERIVISDLADEKIKIVWAGRNNSQKRPDLAYEFCKLIAKESSYTFTVFIDKVGYFSKFSNAIFRNCSIKMPYNNSMVLQNYNVLFLTSDFEGYPLVIIEALSLGLWIICRDSFGAAKSLLNSPKMGIAYPYNYSMNKVLEIIKENELIISNPIYVSERIEYAHSKFDENEHIKKLLNFL